MKSIIPIWVLLLLGCSPSEDVKNEATGPDADVSSTDSGDEEAAVSPDADASAGDAGEEDDGAIPDADVPMEAGGPGPQGPKPTDDSTGPRIPTTDAPGGAVSGTYSGVRFTEFVDANGPLTVTDCVIEGGKPRPRVAACLGTCRR